MLYGVLPLWLFSWFTTWNILSSRSILPIPRLAECIGSGGLQRRLYPVCRKAYAIFAPPVRIHVLHSKRQPEAAGGDFGYRFLWRLVLLAGFATLNAAFSRPGMFCCCSSSRGSSCFLRATGATGYPRRRRRFPVAACRMVPLHSRPAESGPPVARSGGR